MRAGAPEMVNVRAAALTNFDLVARFVGLDPEPLLRAAGLDPSLLGDPDRPLPIEPVAGLLEEAARLSGCSEFGLLMAESRSLASIGPMSLLLLHQPRVSDVVRAMVRHQRVFGDAIHISVDTSTEAVVVRAELAGVPLARQASELFVGFFCRCIAAAIGRPWSPESVHFIHSAPPTLTVHRRLFACPIYFESEFTGIVCARETMDEPNPASDAELAAHAERMLALVLPEPEAPDEPERARRCLRLLLPEQRASIEEVARSMAMTPRSLQRALARHGQSFGALLNEIRRELATRYLAASHPVGVVASLTGYASTSSFTRWFTAEFGVPPARWRREGGGG
jgi:AraC-like DNA-binding protein